MVCPFCDQTRTSVVNSRHTRRSNQVWRRRTCESCGRTFTTREAPQLSFLRVKKREGQIEEYQRSKLLVSLLWSSDHLDEADVAFALADTVEVRLLRSLTPESDQISSQFIAETVQDVLKRFDLKSFIKYVTNREDSLERRDLQALLKNSRD